MQWLWLALIGAQVWAGSDDPPASAPVAADPVAVEPAAIELLPPVLRETAPVPYPQGLDLGEVSVELLLLIDAAGAVEQVSVLSGEEPFAEAAVRAAAGWHFDPALENGQPVAVEVPFTLVFRPPPPSLDLVVHLPDGSPPGAPVSVQVGDQTLSTDAAGLLSLRDLPPGTVQISLAWPGYSSPPASVEIVSGEQTHVEITAVPVPQDDGLIATFRRQVSPAVERSMSAQEVASTPGTLGDPVRAVQNLPGMVRTPLDAGWLIVRGGDPEDTGLYIDGVRVPLIYHLGGLTSVVHPALVQEVAYLPGGYPVRYGRSTAGVVDVRTQPVGDQTRIEFGADLIASGAFVETPINDKVGVSASVRRSYLDAVLNIAPGITEEQSQIAPRFWDWSARVDTDDYGVFAIGSNDEISVPSAEGELTFVYAIGTTRVHGRAEAEVAGHDLLIVPVFARDWGRLSSNDFQDERVSTRGGLRVELPDDGHAEAAWSGGVDIEAGTFVMAVEDSAVTGSFASADPYASYRFGRSPEVVVGLRGDTLWMTDQLARVRPSARLALRQPLNHGLALRGDVGLYHQPPPLADALGYPAGPTLPLEESHGFSVGGELRRQHVDLDVDTFLRRLTHIAVYEEDGTLGQGDGAAGGLETLLRLRQGPVSGWVTYSYTRSYRRLEPGDLLSSAPYDQPNVLGLVAAWGFGKGFTLAGRWRYSSGTPRDPELDTAYDLLTGTETSLSGWPDRLPPYHALDLKISRRLTKAGWAVEGYLDLQNAYNRRVPEPSITGNSYVAGVYTYGLPILPVFGVSGRFVGRARSG